MQARTGRYDWTHVGILIGNRKSSAFPREIADSGGTRNRRLRVKPREAGLPSFRSGDFRSKWNRGPGLDCEGVGGILSQVLLSISIKIGTQEPGGGSNTGIGGNSTGQLSTNSLDEVLTPVTLL